jgi:hypothetical protein
VDRPGPALVKSPHAIVKGPCPGGCGRRVSFDANTNHPRAPLCRYCIARIRREVNELVDTIVIVEKGKLR